MKRVKIQVYIMMTYDNGIHGCDTVFTIRHQCLSGMVYGGRKELGINVDFMNKMLDKEKEMSEFLSKYYNKANSLYKYTNSHKTCKIKDLMIEEIEMI